ncbi:zinc metalloprotease [Bacillus sp. A17A.1]
MAPPERTCGTIDYHNWLLSQSEQYAKERERIEKFTNDFLKNYNLLDNNRFLSDRNIITIPVVVHIVHQNENIVTDQQIQSQIAVLNNDFRRRNSDLIRVPSHWSNLVGDARIEFELRETTRTTTRVAQFTRDDAVKSTDTGGVNPRPSNQFLNIWVCELRNLLGYSTFPGAFPNIDGIVIHHSAFGTTGSASAPNNLGRTATHEIGHWLNLHHLWGDHDPSKPLCNDTDFVDDTPNQEMANFGCPSGAHVTCSNMPHGDMYMNFMDYTDDNCMYMFTLGQIVRMEACLRGPRSSFLQYQNPSFAGAVSGSSMFIQSLNGTRGNFEVVTPLSTGGIIYSTRNNDQLPQKWSSSYIIPNNEGKFESAKLIQSNYGIQGNLYILKL